MGNQQDHIVILSPKTLKTNSRNNINSPTVYNIIYNILHISYTHIYSNLHKLFRFHINYWTRFIRSRMVSAV